MKLPDFHLITYVLCPYVQRSVIVLLEKEIAYKRTDIDLSNTPAWFDKISPMGKVPVLIADQNRALFESAVICEYLDEITPGSLHPDDPLDKAYHRAWIEFGSGLLDSIGGLYNATDKQNFENRRLEIQQKFQLVENEKSVGNFFSGEDFQLIDAVYGPIFRYFEVFDLIIDLGIFDNFPKIKAWRNSLQQRTSVQHAVSEKYSELLLQFLKQRNSYISSFVTAAA